MPGTMEVWSLGKDTEKNLSCVGPASAHLQRSVMFKSLGAYCGGSDSMDGDQRRGGLASFSVPSASPLATAQPTVMVDLSRDPVQPRNPV